MHKRLACLILAIIALASLFHEPLVVRAAEEAAGGEIAGWGWWETIGRWFNLLLLFGLIYYFTREPIARFFATRRKGIQREIEEARKARTEVEEKLASIEGKMAGLDAELVALREQAAEEARHEEDRILSQAEEESQKIVERARHEIQGMTRAARQRLREYTAVLAVEIAEERIRQDMDKESERRFVDRFFVKLSRDQEKLKS